MASDYTAHLKAGLTLRPASPSPGTGQARSELNKVQLRHYNANMVSNSVNKTALHPGGVEYAVGPFSRLCWPPAD